MTPGAGGGPTPPSVFTAAIAVVTLLAIAAPGGELVPIPLRIAGVGLALAGAALHTVAWRHFRRMEAPVATLATPRLLVDTGPYARTRNPMYLAGVVIVAGWALATGCPAGLLVALGFGVMARVRWIGAEERLLAAEFGEDWRHYATRVRRWL